MALAHRLSLPELSHLLRLREGRIRRGIASLDRLPHASYVMLRAPAHVWRGVLPLREIRRGPGSETDGPARHLPLLGRVSIGKSGPVARRRLFFLLFLESRLLFVFGGFAGVVGALDLLRLFLHFLSLVLRPLWFLFFDLLVLLERGWIWLRRGLGAFPVLLLLQLFRHFAIQLLLGLHGLPARLRFLSLLLWLFLQFLERILKQLERRLRFSQLSTLVVNLSHALLTLGLQLLDLLVLVLDGQFGVHVCGFDFIDYFGLFLSLLLVLLLLLLRDRVTSQLLPMLPDLILLLCQLLGEHVSARHQHGLQVSHAAVLGLVLSLELGATLFACDQSLGAIQEVLGLLFALELGGALLALDDGLWADGLPVPFHELPFDVLAA